MTLNCDSEDSSKPHHIVSELIQDTVLKNEQWEGTREGKESCPHPSIAS
jgi:hypothetical protein